MCFSCVTRSMCFLSLIRVPFCFGPVAHFNADLLVLSYGTVIKMQDLPQKENSL